MSDSAPEPVSPIERLDLNECWELLSEGQIGRLAVAAVGTVEIFPLNYLVERKRILFRTAPGTKLLSLTIENQVAFEIDGWTEEKAWSVVVKGSAEALEYPSDLRHAKRLDLTPWSPTPKNVYVEITPDEVTGRRFARGTEPDFQWYW